MPRLASFLTILFSVGAAMLGSGVSTVVEAAPVPKPICEVLALSGGGAFGAVEMGVLDTLVSSGKAPDHYDIITGISAGGLNAGFLSYYDTVTEALPDIQGIFSSLRTPDIYTSDILGLFSEWSIYKTSPLEATLTGILKERVQSPSPPFTMIGSSNLNTSALDVFIFGDKTLAEKVDILMATSAIPFAFPPHRINGSLYVDGGVISNELLTQVIGELPCVNYTITFIDAHPKGGATPPINGFFSYASTVLKMVWNTFDSQVARLNTQCAYPRGVIRACYPTSPLLSSYSMLDFDHGAELYALGKSGVDCETVPLC